MKHIVLISIIFYMIPVHAFVVRVCETGSKDLSAWQVTQTIFDRFNSDYTFEHNKSVSKSEQVRRIKARYDVQTIRRHDVPLSGEDLAKTIQWAASCTGNDFQVLTAILEKESWICNDRTSDTGARGCTHMTKPAIRVFKNQLRLRGRPHNDATSLGKQAFENMIYDCYQAYEKTSMGRGGTNYHQDFIKLFDSSIAEIDRTLLNGNMIHADILSGAILLKLYTAIANGYWVPGRAPGGVYRYNGDKARDANGVTRAFKYQKRVNQLRQNVSVACEYDSYTPQIQTLFCTADPYKLECLESLESHLTDSTYL